MTEKKKEEMLNSEASSAEQVKTDVQEVDVETVMRGAKKIKSKYELLYEDILENQQVNK